MIVARRYRVTGRVQGVGSAGSWSGVRCARGCTGGYGTRPTVRWKPKPRATWRPSPDFESALRTGPSAARVEDLEITEVPPQFRATGFMVRG